MDMPPDYSLCEIDERAYGEVLALWERAGLPARPEGRDRPEAFAGEMAMARQRVIGLRDRAGLVAVAVLTHDGRKGWINRLAVDPVHRRRGLAQALIADAERWFASQGLEVYSALIHADNDASLALFGQAGYQRLDVVYVTKRTRPDA